MKQFCSSLGFIFLFLIYQPLGYCYALDPNTPHAFHDTCLETSLADCPETSPRIAAAASPTACPKPSPVASPMTSPSASIAACPDENQNDALISDQETFSQEDLANLSHELAQALALVDPEQSISTSKKSISSIGQIFSLSNLGNSMHLAVSILISKSFEIGVVKYAKDALAGHDWLLLITKSFANKASFTFMWQGLHQNIFYKSFSRIGGIALSEKQIKPSLTSGKGLPSLTSGKRFRPLMLALTLMAILDYAYFVTEGLYPDGPGSKEWKSGLSILPEAGKRTLEDVLEQILLPFIKDKDYPGVAKGTAKTIASLIENINENSISAYYKMQDPAQIKTQLDYLAEISLHALDDLIPSATATILIYFCTDYLAGLTVTALTFAASYTATVLAFMSQRAHHLQAPGTVQ